MEAPLFERILSLWRTLEPRERLVITAGSIIALVMLFYTFLWMPVQRDLTRLRVDVPKTQTQLARMQLQARQVTRLQAGTTTATPSGNLLSTLERSALDRGLRRNITRMEPDGSAGVRLALDGVGFNTLLRWLTDLQQRSGVRVESATITAQSSPGIVDARLLLRRPGA
ncbi:MAG: type II secretion system protein GspM [Acidiferrobacterales bacterium]